MKEELSFVGSLPKDLCSKNDMDIPQIYTLPFNLIKAFLPDSIIFFDLTEYDRYLFNKDMKERWNL